jgi:hypothetical protein
MYHLNKKSTMKTSNIEDYPYHPKYIDGKQLNTKGLIGEGYQVSRPVTIESRWHEVMAFDTFKDDERIARSARQLNGQNSRTEWIENYSAKSKERKASREQQERDAETRKFSPLGSKFISDIAKIEEIDSKLARAAEEEELRERAAVQSAQERARMRETMQSVETFNSQASVSRPSVKADAKGQDSPGRHVWESQHIREKQAAELSPRGGSVHTEHHVSFEVQSVPERRAGSREKHRHTGNPVSPSQAIAITENPGTVDYNYYELWRTKHGLPHDARKQPATATSTDQSSASPVSLSDNCSRVINLHSQAQSIAAQLALRMPSNLYNLYQLIKRREDVNLLTKRDLQLFLNKIGLECPVIASDILYDLLDFGSDGVVCFSDFERALLPRDNSVLSISRKAINANFKTLEDFGPQVLASLREIFARLIDISELVHVLRRDHWREIKGLKKDNKRGIREILAMGPLSDQHKNTSSDDELAFIGRILVLE